MRREIVENGLRLRVPCADDAGLLESLAGEWDVARMLATMPYPVPEGAARKWIARMAELWDEGRGFNYLIECETVPAGVISLGQRPDVPAMELGYWIGRPYWGRGLASASVRLVLEAYFSDTARDLVVCNSFLDNPASERVIRKSGFRELGLADKWCAARGAAVPAREFEMTRAEWQALAVGAQT